MNKYNVWNQFIKTGDIRTYIEYKRLDEESKINIENQKKNNSKKN